MNFKLSNPLFASGVMLYWAEGSKYNENVEFTNSDPEMISVMMKWFREVCKVPEEKFRIALQIIAFYHDREETEKIWSEITGIPRNQFNKTIVKSTPLKGKRNPSYYGTCTIRISDKNLFRKIRGWKIGISEGLVISPHSLTDKARRF